MCKRKQCLREREPNENSRRTKCVPRSGVIIPFFAGIGIGIVVTNHLLDLNSGIGSSSGTVTSL